jgi:hypothetical protein
VALRFRTERFSLAAESSLLPDPDSGSFGTRTYKPEVIE